MRLLDCTLRDGANVVGKGFSAELTEIMLRGLTANGVKVIEYGNCLGLGAYDLANSVAPLTDEQYLDLVAPFVDKGEIGMFLGAANARKDKIAQAASKGLRFLRVGANAGDGEAGAKAVDLVKEAGLDCHYSLMKAYVLSADELAAESAMLAGHGLDEITIMDSSGTMAPDQVSEYVAALVKAVDIPVGFHGHNNLGLSAANALAAMDAGAQVLDCGLLGMARSAGNLATEIIVGVMQRKGLLPEIDLLGLLEFLDKELVPAMAKYDFHAPVSPLDLVLGYAGCHSAFVPTFAEVAEKNGVNLFQLIMTVSEKDRKAPSRELMESVAASL